MPDEAHIIGNRFEMGASVKKVSLDKIPLSSHAFATLDGRQFNVRSTNYEGTGVKIPSNSNMGEVVGIDVFQTEQKLPHIMKHIDIPDDYIRHSDHEPGNSPKLFVINFMVPNFAPSNPVWGKQKINGKGYSVVLYIRVKSQFENSECQAGALLKRFMDMNCASDDDYGLRSRLKGIPILLNPEVLNGGMPLRQLVKTYSSKPFLTGPKHQHYIKTDAYLECDVDVHQWIYPARKALHTLMPEITKLELDLGFVIEGYGEENPERMLCSVRIGRLNPDKAIRII